MISRTLVRKVVLAEYSLVRGSLQAFDTRVASRYLADDSPVRVVFERGLTVLDSAAAHLLRTQKDSAQESLQDTTAEDTTAEDTTTEDTTTEDTTTEDTTAEDTTAEDTAVASAAVEADPVEEIERVAEELLEEREETPLTGELAEESDDDASAMAELRAKHIVEEYEAQQREKAGE